MLKFKFILIGLFFGLFWCGIVIGKDYNDVLDHFFFGRQPSAKAEAMGKSMITTGADAFGLFHPKFVHCFKFNIRYLTFDIRSFKFLSIK